MGKAYAYSTRTVIMRVQYMKLFFTPLLKPFFVTNSSNRSFFSLSRLTPRTHAVTDSSEHIVFVCFYFFKFHFLIYRFYSVD